MPVDNKLYKILGVSTNATEKEIKKFMMLKEFKSSV